MRAQSITAPSLQPTAMASLIAPKIYSTASGTAMSAVDNRPSSQPFHFFDLTRRQSGSNKASRSFAACHGSTGVVCHNAMLGCAEVHLGRAAAVLIRVSVALLLMTMLPTPLRAESRIALLIGKQGYAPEVGALANPHNDIAVLEQILKALGFGVTSV